MVKIWESKKPKNKSESYIPMSTQVNVEPVVETAVVDPAQAKVDAILKDEAIVTDATFVRLFSAITAQEKVEGGKWYKLIRHTKDVLMTKHEKDEWMNIVLKSLLSQGKTYSSAQSIRSYIVKMAKDENAELLEKLNSGAVTVRESRAFGRKAQVNPAKTNEDKFVESVQNTVRFGIACNLNLDAIVDRVRSQYNKIAKD